MPVVSIDPIARSMEAQTRRNNPREWRRDVLVQEKEHERGLNGRARLFLCRTAGARTTLILRRRAPRVRTFELFERLQAVTDGAAHFDESRAISVDARFVHPGFAELKKFGRLADGKQPVKIRLRHFCLSLPCSCMILLSVGEIDGRCFRSKRSRIRKIKIFENVHPLGFAPLENQAVLLSFFGGEHIVRPGSRHRDRPWLLPLYPRRRGRILAVC